MTTQIEAVLMAENFYFVVNTDGQKDRLMLITNMDFDSDDLKTVESIINEKFNLTIDWWVKKGSSLCLVLKER